LLLHAGQPLPLDDLNGDALMTLPALAGFVDDPVVLAPGTTRSYDVDLATMAGVGNGGALLVEAAFSEEDDLENVGHLWSQARLAPVTIYLPLITR
jgi:hypothetical protein